MKIKNYINSLKNDLPSGLVVFLVALPLCLGIALASGAPLFSGLVTGIIGGVVVGFFSGSQLSVSGPAAGLTVIILNAINILGTYEAFLLAVVFAGLLQIIFGIIRAGSLAYYFPSSVIKGMLAAIGIILILKQIPHAFGYDEDYVGDFAFKQIDNENTFTELYNMLSKSHTGAIFISLISMAILVLWEQPFMKKLKLIPGPLIVVIVGIIINTFIFGSHNVYGLSGNQLVNIPVVNNSEEFLALFIAPDFSQILNKHVYFSAATIAIIASIETLLSTEAIDKLDPYKRVTPPNRELLAQGAGNVISGLLGGIPMTAVIVRGSANVNSGAKTKVSTVFHGLLLLISLLLIPTTINQIPLASLSIILLMTGYKLNKISLYKEMYKAGYSRYIPFLSTIIAVVFTDMFIGIVIGMAVSILFQPFKNLKNINSFKKDVIEPNKMHIILFEEVSFFSKANLQKTLIHLPENSSVIIDGSKSKYIDYDVLEVLYDFCDNAKYRKVAVELINIPKLQ